MWPAKGFQIVHYLFAEVEVMVHHFGILLVNVLEGRVVVSIEDCHDHFVEFVFIYAFGVGAVRCSEDSI